MNHPTNVIERLSPETGNLPWRHYFHVICTLLSDKDDVDMPCVKGNRGFHVAVYIWLHWLALACIDQGLDRGAQALPYTGLIHFEKLHKEQ